MPFVPASPYGDLLDSTMRVVTWNLWGRLGDWEARRAAIATTLDGSAPDVVVLQEAWSERRGESQAAELGERLGLHASFVADDSEDGVDVGVAVLSRWPVRSVDSIRLPLPPGARPENVVVTAEIAGPRGTFLVFGTHLAPFPHRSALRCEQVRALGEFVARFQPQPYPAIVCGDFNATPESDEIRMLTGRTAPAARNVVFLDAWETAGDGSPGHTVDRANPNFAPVLLPSMRWDYLFVTWPSGIGGAGHPLAADLLGTAPVDGIWPSDHFGLAVDLRY